MRPIRRLQLPSDTERLLANRTKRIIRKRKLATRVAQAESFWKSRPRSFLPVPEILGEAMAPAPGRCMYCEHSEGTSIDHFWPLASHPERAFVWENLLWACSHCNSNDKRDRFPLDSHGHPLLIDPTDPNDDPARHLDLHPPTGRFVGKTPQGTASIDVFGLKRQFLETGRKDAWISAQVHLEAYADAKAIGDTAHADAIRATLIRAPHGAVLRHLLTISHTPVAMQYIRRECLDVLSRHPEVFGWM